MRVESLEARELLSVAPISGFPTVDDAFVARESYVTAPVVDAAVLGATNTPPRLATPVLSVADKTDTTATVSWDAVPNAERYSFSYKLASETTWTNKNVGTNVSYTVSGLTSNTEYDFRVKAIGDGVNYKSVYSAPVGAKTDATPVRPVPLDTPELTVEAASTSLVVLWDPVENAERYSFSYKPASATYSWRVIAVGDGINYKNSDPTAARTVKARQEPATPSASVSATINLDAGFFEEFFDELEEDDFDLLATKF